MSLEQHLEGNVLMLRMNAPPVNCLSWPLRRELQSAFLETAGAAHIGAVVLYGAGKHFCAGGDLRELGTPAGVAAPRLATDLLPCIERCAKPVVAALHGGVIGGGFELALACHARVALADARIALPELKHGIIPLSGAVRLPRLLGIGRAVAMILESRTLSAAQLRATGVLDRVLDGEASGGADAHAALLSAAIELARQAADGSFTATLVRHRPFADADPRVALAQALRAAPAAPTPAQGALLAAVRAGVESEDFDAALLEAQRIYDALAPLASKRA